MSQINLVTSEENLVELHNDAIAEFWQHGTFDHFSGKGNCRINYAAFVNNSVEQSIVISPGRSECYLKYKEVAFELYSQNYNVFIIDHRGQGLSQRLTSNPHKGYVENFDDYSEDLATFLNQVVLKEITHLPFLLAHSMGAAIGLRCIQHFEQKFQAVALLCPMFAANSGRIPQKIARAIVNIGYTLNRLFSKDPWYFIGQGDYKGKIFTDNPLMQSRARFDLFNQLYLKTAQIQLGGATFKWLYEAIKIRKKLFTELEKISLPILVLRAGDERVVDNNEQRSWLVKFQQQKAQACPNPESITIANAKHELLFEQDDMRKQALTTILTYFKKYHE